MESDATWELNIRPIMSELSHYFRDLVRTPASATATPADPWMTEEWDVIALGHCIGSRAPNGPEVKYHSQYANEGPMEWKGVKLNGERFIHRAKNSICLAAYVVSLRGAAKLLLRSAIDLNDPVDLVINYMSEKGQLVVYNVVQPPFVQWKYRKGIGMDAGNSDIRFGNGPKNTTTTEPERDMSAWPEVKKDHSVWRPSGFYKTGTLKESALTHAWEHIFADVQVKKP